MILSDVTMILRLLLILLPAYLSSIEYKMVLDIGWSTPAKIFENLIYMRLFLHFMNIITP